MIKNSSHVKAINLRKTGKSYSYIKRELGLSNDSLARWLQNYPLNQEQQLNLSPNERKIEKFRLKMKEKNEKRLSQIYKISKQELLPLSDRELYIAGLFLYLGEGAKNMKGQISLCNTSPSVMKFYMHWLVYICKVPMNKLRVLLHLYSDMSIENELSYWSKLLKIPRNQFVKPYVKESEVQHIQHTGYGHGTCGVFFRDVLFKEKLMMSLKAISDYYTGLGT